MPNPVTVDHVIARFRPLSASETTNAEAWIEDAWGILTEHRTSMETDLDNGDISENAVIRVVAEAVIRKLDNPGGYSEERGDDYGFKRHESVATGKLYLSEAELAQVTPSGTTGGRSRNSVRLVAYGES